eukprot:TRINITY_DN14290_c0_g3_i3.p1 TRINITY_DN14290_c0_g3~~TRINITY_DN14290_c0_g3_i3.p1  ORF type:complete len:195 (-),score=30.94 TRINITY_DN14290_c0_g3_i3:140-724(-)
MEEQLRLVSSRKIRLGIKRKLGRYGRTLSERAAKKLLSGALSFSQCASISAYVKSANIIGAALIAFEKIGNVKDLFSQFTEKILLIQRVWRRVMSLDNTRRAILKSKWDKAVQKLIMQHKGKKHSSVASKLLKLTDTDANKAIKKLYTTKKSNYHRSLSRHYQESSKPKRLPVFKYIPNADALNKIILQLTHKR